MSVKRGTKQHALLSKPKRNAGQIDSDRVFIAEHYSKGLTHREIAERLNASRPYQLSRTIVSLQIHDIIEEWRKHTLADVGPKIAEELLRLNRIEREAWEAWERSKAESVKTVSEKRTGAPATTPVTATEKNLARVIKDGRDGDPRFLMIVGNCVTERCKLLGLYPAIKHGGADGLPLQPLNLIAQPPVMRVVFEQTEETRAIEREYNVLPD